MRLIRPMDPYEHKSQRVKIISTGGTFEKTYDESDGTVRNRSSIIGEILQHNLRLPHTEITIHQLMNKDSLTLTDADRAKILATIAEAQHNGDPIVVTHGTDTMAKTANYCESQLPAVDVPVVFTGAMRPYGFKDSDALQNLTEALMAALLVPPGYYVAFHNRVMAARRARKNKETMTFDAID